MADLRELDRRAVLGSADVARAISPDQLRAPTPCAGWTVLDLLEHMAVQHHGFAAAARGKGADPAIWAPGSLGDDPVAAYLQACEDVIAAFAEPDVLERTFALPEISTEITFPAGQAISFHFVDYLVHGWDLAVAIGAPYAPNRELIDAGVAVAERVPAGEARLRSGAAFAPVVDGVPKAPTLERILTLLGRAPDWAPPH
jgi:uncharacterized protein (TIGR03086 family)